MYEGEVTELTPEETLNPAGGYGKVISPRRDRPQDRQGHQAAQAGPHHLRQVCLPFLFLSDPPDMQSALAAATAAFDP